MRDAADTAHDVLDMASDIKAAARRFGFRRQTNRHPVEDIDDPKIAVAGVAVSFYELGDFPTADQRHALQETLKADYGLNAADADELTVLGRWMMTQCGGPQQGIDRLSRKLYKLDGAASFGPLMGAVKAVAENGDRPLNSQQKSAIEDIKTAFRITG